MSEPKKRTGRSTAEVGVRQVRMCTSGASLKRLPGGVLLVKPDETLRPYPKVLTDRLAHWATSLDAGEITGKGSFNQRAVLDRRAALVEQLYLEEPPPSILRTDRK
jgi:hypothetical protein